MAHASGQSLVTVVVIRDIDLLASEETAAGTLTVAYIGGIAEAPRGAWPVSLWNIYGYDEEHIRLYCESARSDEGFAQYLGQFIFDRQAAERSEQQPSELQALRRNSYAGFRLKKKKI